MHGKQHGHSSFPCFSEHNPSVLTPFLTGAAGLAGAAAEGPGALLGRPAALWGRPAALWGCPAALWGRPGPSWGSSDGAEAGLGAAAGLWSGSFSLSVSRLAGGS